MSKNDKPLVSIGIPTYNRAESLKRAINSAVNQTYTNLEIIISDNCSIDETQQLCEELCKLDSRITYIRQAKNFGATNNFSFVLKKATGEYFMWLADDDWISENYIYDCQFFLQNNHQYLLCSGIAKYYLGDDIRMGENICLEENSPIERVKEYFNKVQDNGIFYGLYRKEAVLKLRIPSCFGGDWVFIACILLLGKATTLNTCVIHRVFQEKSTEDYAKEINSKYVLEKSYPYAFICFHFFSEIERTLILQNILTKQQKILLFLDILLTLMRRFGHLYSIEYGWLNIFCIRKKLISLLKIIIRNFRQSCLYFIDSLRTFIYNLKYTPQMYQLYASSKQKNSDLKKLAFFSPVKPIKSGISDYSEELIRFLCKKYQIFVFIDDSYTEKQCPNIENTFYLNHRLFPITSKILGIKKIVYQIGNNYYHNYMFKYINKNHGIVVLHDGIHMSGDRKSVV